MHKNAKKVFQLTPVSPTGGVFSSTTRLTSNAEMLSFNFYYQFMMFDLIRTRKNRCRSPQLDMYTRYTMWIWTSDKR